MSWLQIDVLPTHCTALHCTPATAAYSPSPSPMLQSNPIQSNRRALCCRYTVFCTQFTLFKYAEVELRYKCTALQCMCRTPSRVESQNANVYPFGCARRSASAQYAHRLIGSAPQRTERTPRAQRSVAERRVDEAATSSLSLLSSPLALLVASRRVASRSSTVIGCGSAICAQIICRRALPRTLVSPSLQCFYVLCSALLY